MNLLTNGFVNNCGRLFGRSEHFEADIWRLADLPVPIFPDEVTQFRVVADE
jgi:hypothetical protein